MYRYFEKKAFAEGIVDDTAMTVGGIGVPLALGAWLLSRGKGKLSSAVHAPELNALTGRVGELEGMAGRSGAFEAAMHPLQAAQSAFGKTTDFGNDLAKHHEELATLKAQLNQHKSMNPHVDIDPHLKQIDQAKQDLTRQQSHFTGMGRLGLAAGTGLGGYHIYKRWNPDHNNSLSDRISRL